MSFPYYKQDDSIDCGPTCVGMVAKHHERNFKVQMLRRLYEMNRGAKFRPKVCFTIKIFLTFTI